MNTERIFFLNRLIKEISGLNYVLLNYFYDEVEHIPASMPIEILVDKDDYTTLLYVISSARRIAFIRTKYGLRSQVIEIRFSDLSSVILKIKAAVTASGNVLIETNDILKTAQLVKSSVRIPSAGFQFEYVLLNSTLRKSDVPEYQQEYFAGMNFEKRSQIFAHITSKYKFVIHLLDDLYSFHFRHYRKIKSAIYHNNKNRGIHFFIHKVQYFFQYMFTLFFARWQEISLTEQGTNESSTKQSLNMALHKNAVVKLSS